jgi:predicted DNA-binding protein
MSLMKKQTAFRIDETLLTQLNAIARIKDLSLNALVNDIISQYIEELRDSPTFMSEVDNLIKKDVAALKSLLPPT